MTNPLQGFIIAALFMGIRNPTFAQFVSQFTSITMVYLSLSKALMPPGVWSNKEESLGDATLPPDQPTADDQFGKRRWQVTP